MAYPYYNGFTGYGYQPQIPQVPQVPQVPQGAFQQTAPQTQTVYLVPSYDTVKNFYVEPGKPETFFDSGKPYCYVKSPGASPVDPPKTRIFELVERSEEYLTRGAQSGDISASKQSNIDLSKYATSDDIEALRGECEALKQAIERLRFDVDALSEKSTKKLVQKARKDADDE